MWRERAVKQRAPADEGQEIGAHRGLKIAIGVCMPGANAIPFRPAPSTQRAPMRFARIPLLVLSILLLASPRAFGGDELYGTAIRVASWCAPYRSARVTDEGVSVPEQGKELDLCWGAFLAIQQMSKLGVDGSDRTVINACVPPEVRTLEYVLVFLKYVESHPEVGHERFLNVAVRAIRQAFPCPPSGGDTKKPNRKPE